jgi:hypothetical protein
MNSLRITDLIKPLVLLYSGTTHCERDHISRSDHFPIKEVAMARPSHILSSLICGIGLTLTLSACSVTETVKDILSSTTPGDWFTADGVLKGDQKVNAFVALNLENLKQDMAQGHGEYLTSLSTLLGVPQDRQASFFAHAQSRYPFVLAHQSNPQEVIALLVEKAPVIATR